MKNTLKHFYALAIVLLMSLSAHAGDLDIKDGKWKISFNNDNKTVSLSYDGTLLTSDVYVRVGNKPAPTQLDVALSSREATSVELKKEKIDDAFGRGTKYTYIYNKEGEDIALEQSFYVYKKLPYLLTQAAAVADKDITFNYIAAIVSDSPNAGVLPAEGDNRVFDMPFDNDAWHTFSAIKWDDAKKGTCSMEATAFYNVDSRRGMVIGTVDHDTWKSAACATTSGQNSIDSLHVYAGYAGERTWDEISGKNRHSLARHGALTGKRIASPRVFVGLFDDWRIGLENYGEANAIVTPKRPWQGGTIFGWQSWGGMAQRLNFDGAMEVANYFHEKLPHMKNEQGKVFLILDAFWDNMSDEQLSAFVARCKENGQTPGIYDTPYSFWGGYDNVEHWGTGIDNYTYGDIILRVGGKPKLITGISIDPTHPVTKKLVKRRVERLKRLGFKYIKIDFMNNASVEADSYFDKKITTGMQAYNEGLRYYAECCGPDIFLNLSIAPVWPSCYAQGRRIGCDAWGSKDLSMYTLNCMNLSWWLEKVYSFNDPDHLVYVDKTDDKEAKKFKYHTGWSLGLNRIRTTTGIMCGTLVVGDNLSLNEGTCRGIQEARDRTEQMTSIPEIGEIARHGKMFRPVEGTQEHVFDLWGKKAYCDNIFMLDTEKAYYVSVFNFGDEELTTDLSFERLGVKGNKAKSIKEVWNQQTVDFIATGFTAKVAPQDVCIYKIEKK